MAAQEDKEVDEPKQLSQMEMKRIIDDMHKEKKEKSEEKKRVHCKYISEIDCVNVDAIIEGKLGQDKDKKGRPNYAYCFKVCMPHVLPMHQRTAQFQAMVTMTHMFTQLNQAIIHGVKLFEGQLQDTGLLPRPQRKPQIMPQKTRKKPSKPSSEDIKETQTERRQSATNKATGGDKNNGSE